MVKLNKDPQFLRTQARIVRRDIIELAHECGRNTHIGPAFSCTDICTALYYGFMDVDPENPGKEDRDRLVFSKGHACPVIYAILSELGFFPKSWYSGLRHPNSKLQGHPSYGKTPGIDMTSGSLGNGLGIGVGMAYYLKLQKRKSKVYVILGDGEMNEGTAWEAANYAPVVKLDNLIVIIDQNGFQSCGHTNDILPMNNMAERFHAFGWNVLEMDGHDMEDIVNKLEIAIANKGLPTCIVAKTTKGKGVSFIENNNKWHQKVLTEDEYIKAVAELEEEI